MPEKREVMLEQDALNHIDTGVGQLLEFQLPDGSTKTMPVVGVVQDTAAGAGDFLASPYGYITMDTLPYLGQPRLFNRGLVIVSERGDDIFHVRDMGAKLKDKLEKNDSLVIRMRFSETHKHPLADTVNAILGILMALGILIVFLSSSLIANTLNALLNQHLRYIGVIKLVGGQDARFSSRPYAHHGVCHSGAADCDSAGRARRLWSCIIHCWRIELQHPGLPYCASGPGCANPRRSAGAAHCRICPRH
jgi:hypothetical protein